MSAEWCKKTAQHQPTIMKNYSKYGVSRLWMIMGIHMLWWKELFSIKCNFSSKRVSFPQVFNSSDFWKAMSFKGTWNITFALIFGKKYSFLDIDELVWKVWDLSRCTRESCTYWRKSLSFVLGINPIRFAILTINWLNSASKCTFSNFQQGKCTSQTDRKSHIVGSNH